MTNDMREWAVQILNNRKSDNQKALCKELEKMRNREYDAQRQKTLYEEIQNKKYFTRKKPYVPNYSEVFGMMREYGPAHGVVEGSFNPEEDFYPNDEEM